MTEIEETENDDQRLEKTVEDGEQQNQSMKMKRA